MQLGSSFPYPETLGSSTQSRSCLRNTRQRTLQCHFKSSEQVRIPSTPPSTLSLFPMLSSISSAHSTFPFLLMSLSEEKGELLLLSLADPEAWGAPELLPPCSSLDCKEQLHRVQPGTEAVVGRFQQTVYNDSKVFPVW